MMIVDDAQLATTETAADDFDWGDDSATFGDRLARAREAGGMNQSELARRLGVKLATVRNWEADRSAPRSNRLQMLTGLLNVSIIWLMTGEGDGAPDIVDAGPETATLKDLMDELRDIRVEQTRLVERSKLVEKRLRGLIAGG